MLACPSRCVVSAGVPALTCAVLCTCLLRQLTAHAAADAQDLPDVKLTWEPPNALPPDGSPGVCNAYLHGLSPFQRLLWVVAFLSHNDFVVVLVNDLQRDQSLLVNQTAWAQVLALTRSAMPCKFSSHELEAA